MKNLVVLLMFVTSIAQADTVDFKDNEVNIEGLKVSGRHHWNGGLGPELLFCLSKGFNSAITLGTTYERVPKQEMVFFTASPVGKKVMTTRSHETLAITKVSCSDEVSNWSENIIKEEKKQLKQDEENL